MPTVKIEHNVLTGEIIERELTQEEMAQFKLDQLDAIKRMEAQQSAKDKRAAALAKLEALGLDEDDLKALGL